MAVFPQKISLKNSTDGDAFIRNAISSGGSDEIDAGEVVISRRPGSAALYTVDSNGEIVQVGFGEQAQAVIEAWLIQNFESDPLETPYTNNQTNPIPYLVDPKFGTGSVFLNNTDEFNFTQNITFEGGDLGGGLGTNKWTVEFWIKSNQADWYRQTTGAGGPGPLGSMAIFGWENFHAGVGAFNVYLDAGTEDQAGYGTTSRVTNVAQGAVCFGLWPGYPRSSTITGVPDTGEILCSGLTSVTDNAWHYVVIQHEGLGVYSMYVDGSRVDRNFLGEVINFSSSDPADSLQSQPFSLILGGQSSDPFNDPDSNNHVPVYGFKGQVDAIRLLQDSFYPSWTSVPVPANAPGGEETAPRLELRDLEDTDIPVSIPDLSVLSWNDSNQKWEPSAAPAYDISANSLGDLGDVVISGSATGDLLRWNGTQWENSKIGVEDLVDVTAPLPTVGDFLVWNGTFYEKNQSTVCIVSGTEPTARPNSTLLLEGDQWLDDVNTNLYVYSSGSFVLAGGGGGGGGATSLGELTDVTITNPAASQTLAYNSGTGQWENVSAPPADISGNNLHDLGDVSDNLTQRVVGAAPVYDGLNQEGVPEYVIRQLNYSEITGTTGLSTFFNDAGYLTDLFSSPLEELSNVDRDNATTDGDIILYSTNANEWRKVNQKWLRDAVISDTPQNGATIIWNGTNWVDGTGGGGGAVELGDLTDVTRSVEDVTFTGTSQLLLSGSNSQVNTVAAFGSGASYEGAYLKHEKGTKVSGIFLDYQYGVKLVSDSFLDSEVFRFQGPPATHGSNRPQLRLETADYDDLSPTGLYISIGMPDTVSENVDYKLPSADGVNKQFLQTDGLGNLEWADPSGAAVGATWRFDTPGTTPNYQGEFTFDSSTFSLVTEVRIGIENLDGLTFSGLLKSLGNVGGYINIQESNGAAFNHTFKVNSLISTGLVIVLGVDFVYSEYTQMQRPVGEDCQLRFYFKEDTVIGSINDITDVDTTTDPPEDQEALVWSTNASKWVPGAVAGSAGRGEGGDFDTGATKTAFVFGVYGGGNFDTGVEDKPAEFLGVVDGGVFA